MAELNPPLGTTTPEIFLDNVKRADRLVNGPEETVDDRGGQPLDTWRQMMAKNDEVRQNIIPLSKQYMTLAAAQADIANIPEGSTTYYRSTDDRALAIEIINNGGTLEHTGREMPSQYALREPIKEAAHASQSPAAAGVSANDIDDEYEYAIADRQGRIIERINADFIHRFIFPIISQQAKLGSAKGLSGIFYQDDIALGLDASGNVTAGSTETGTSNDMLYGVVDSSGRCLFRFGMNNEFVQNGTEYSTDSDISDDLYKLLTRSKRAARTVLTGMCYSVGSATRQGSSSLTRFIGQSAMTSRT